MQRLSRRSDLKKVLKEGHRYHSPWVTLHIRYRGPNQELATELRIVAIASRGFGRAVTRNRAIRVVREACRLALGSVSKSWDLVLVARPAVLTLKFTDLVNTISHLLCQAGILAEEATTAA